MMENVGKIRIGVDVDSDNADKSLDGLYKKIRDLNNSINKLLSGHITLKVGVDKQSLESTKSEINSYIKSLNDSVVKINLKLDAGAEKNISNEIDNALSNAFSNTGSNEGVFAQSMTGFKDAIQSEQAILSFVKAITDLQTVLDNVRFNDNAAEFFKKLTSSLAQTSTWGIAANNINNTWASILTFFDNLSNLDIDISKTEQIRNALKNLKGVYNVGETANLSSLANNLSGVQSTISGLNTEELLAKSKDIRAFVTNTSTIQNIPDTTALGTLASNLIAFNNKISSISATSDEQKKVISYVVSIVNKLASINISTSTFDLSTVGNQLITFANSLNTINISDTATKTISTFSSVLNKIAKMSEVLSGITFNSANINAFITGIADLVQKLESVNISDKAEKIIKLADAIKTLNNASKDKSGSNLSKSSSLIDKLGKVSNTTLGVVKKLGTAFSNLGRKTKEVGTSANKVAQTIKKSYTELLSKIRLITGTIKTFINTFKTLSSAYNTQASAETRFTVAATNSANATKEQINNIKDLTAEYQQLGILGDEVQLTGLQELSTYVESTESIKKLLPIMNDMTAQQFGFEATTENAFTIATALGKVLNGNTDTLKRYGYAFNDAEKQILKYGTEEQKVAVLTQVVEASVGGMNNALANTPTGQITQLKNNFGDLKESLGELLTYAVLPLAKYINILILRIQSGVQALTQFIKTAFGIKTITKDINTITDGVSNVNNKNIDKTSDSLDDLGDSASKTKKKVNNLLGSFDELNILSDNSSDSTDNLADALNSIDSDSLDLGYGVSETIEVPDINDFKNSIKKLFNSVNFEQLGIDWGSNIDALITKWNPVTSAKKLANAINKVVLLANGLITSVDFKKLGTKIAQWLNTLAFNINTKNLGKLLGIAINNIIKLASGFVKNTNFKLLGKKIGDFIVSMFENIDIKQAVDSFATAIFGIFDMLAEIIQSIDFNKAGKTLGEAFNKIFKVTKWKDVGKTLSDAIIGVLDFTISFLNSTDFEKLGKSIGAFLAAIDWGTILVKAGQALWAGLNAALQITSGIFKENALAGTITTLVVALTGFKGLSGIINIIKGITGALGGVGTLAVGIGILTIALVDYIDQLNKLKVQEYLTTYLNKEIPVSEKYLKVAAENIGIDFDNIVSSATNCGFVMDQETGKMVGYIDNMRVEIDAKTGEISGYYERLKLGDLPEVFGAAIDSMSAKFDTNSKFITCFKDSKTKVDDLKNEISQIAPTINKAGTDTSKAVDELISALDKLKDAEKSAKKSAGDLLTAFVNSSNSILEKNGVNVEQINKDIEAATLWSKELTDKQIKRFKELSDIVASGKELTEAEAIEYNDLLDKMTGGNITALRKNKQELEDYIKAIQEGRITFNNPEEARAVIEDITDRYHKASEKVTEYSEYVSQAIDTLDLPEDTKKAYQEMFGSLLTVEQSQLDRAFIATKGTIGGMVEDLWIDMKKEFGEPKANEFWRDTLNAVKIKGEDFNGKISSGLISEYNNKLLPQLKTAFDNLNTTYGDSSKEAALATMEEIDKALKNASKSITKTTKENGMNATQGYIDGLKSKKGELLKTSAFIASIPLTKGKEILKEHSPSKAMAEIGENATLGFYNGLKSKTSNTLKLVQTFMNDVITKFKIVVQKGNTLKTYAYEYITYFMKGIKLEFIDNQKISNLIKSIITMFKLKKDNYSLLAKYAYEYIEAYISGFKINNNDKNTINNVITVIMNTLRPSSNTLNNAKIYGESIVQSMISGMTVSSANKTTISNAGTTVYNSMINSMNNLSGSLSTSSNNFIHNLTNPITNGLSALLSAMDSFYTKFRNKWQGVANLLSNKFIGNSMGITKVPNLNDNYYPFGNNIVKLAQGAVIKPNNEFMAILGDQKRGVNIETPLATMKQAFIEALNDGGYNGGNITIPVYIGNEKIDTLIVNSNNRRGMRNNGRV